VKKNQKALFAAVLFTLSCGGIFSQNVKDIHADEQNEVTEIPVCINEICAKNTTIAHEDGNFYDWVELYNRSSEEFDISGFGLSEKEKKPFKYVFPEGTVIGPGERFVVWCDKDKGQSDETVASISLSADGETVILTSPDSVTADKVTYGAIAGDISYGRVPDGSDMLCMLRMSMGSENSKDDIIVPAPEMSAESGFYSEAFDLEIVSQGDMKVYYTLDGSEPDTGSLLYDGPVRIDDISAQENVISAIEDITFSKYSAPSSPVDKAVVIKAAAADENGNMSETAVRTFFVGYENKASYYSDMKVVSVITDSDGLFSDENGIYVKGDTYRKWLESDRYDPQTPTYSIPSNYTKHGSDWEREAVIQIFENGVQMASQNMGIRIHGGASRSTAQKSFNVYARGRYGASKLKYDLFSGKNTSEYDNSVIKKYDSFILRNAGNDASRLRFRDKLIQSLVSDLNFSVQAMEPCIVFINGEYWGQYEITERLCADYVTSHFGVEEDSMVLVKNGEYEDGNESLYSDYTELCSWVSDPGVDLTDEGNYLRLEEMIDVQGYIDYMCAEIYAGNYDWGTNNTALWKAEYDADNSYADGRWRFIMFDTEYSSNLYANELTEPACNIFERINGSDDMLFVLFRKLMLNEGFRDTFCRRFTDISNGCFESEKVSAAIDELVSAYRESTLDYYDRFYCGQFDNEKRYDEKLKDLRDFYDQRPQYITEYLRKFSGTDAQTADVSIYSKDGYADIKVNGYTADTGNDGVWNGKFFTGSSVNISVSALEGHEFRYIWLSDGRKITEPEADTEISGSVMIKVVFDDDTVETEIIKNSEDITVTEGDSAVFSVEASGEDLTYKWYWRRKADRPWNESTFEGSDTDTMTVPAALSRDGYQYRCCITNSDGVTVKSDISTLKVAQKPEITVQPEDISVKEGGMAEFSVTASGTELSYQWQFKTKLSDWKNCSESTAGYNCPELKVAAEMKRDGYLYRCIVKNAAGYEVVSSSVKLGVFIPSHAEITAEPQNVLVPAGSTAQMRIGVQGDVAGYQWYWRKNSTCQWAESTFEGNDTSVMSVPAELKRNGYQYRCCITLEDGSVIESAAAVLGIIPAENNIIVSQPSSAELSAGETAVYKVTAASETAEYRWQWKKPGKSWSDCTEKTEGYNTSELKVYAEEKRNGYQYRCIVTDTRTGKTYTSDTVLLLVK